MYNLHEFWRKRINSNVNYQLVGIGQAKSECIIVMIMISKFTNLKGC